MRRVPLFVKIVSVGLLIACAGCTGDQGPTGPAGADGLDGATGQDGAAGATGPAGADGQNGADGATGPAGPAGADGQDGADGAAGPAGPTGPAGADGQDGADGATGPAGADGQDGADGATGPAGESWTFTYLTGEFTGASPQWVCPDAITNDPKPMIQAYYAYAGSDWWYPIPGYIGIDQVNVSINFTTGCAAFVGFPSGQSYLMIIAIPTGTGKHAPDYDEMREYLRVTKPADIISAIDG